MKLPSPEIARVRWSRAVRIIASIFPPIDLFEDAADPADWELLLSLESKSNPRLTRKVGNLALVPADRRVSGSGASWVMAPFTHVSPRWTGRFHDGRFGAYYAAGSSQTALVETMYHRARIYRASGEAPGWIAQVRELVGRIDARLHDVRDLKLYAKIHAPDSYEASQKLARTLRASGSNGVVFQSVRDPGGQCIAAFWPDVVDIPQQGRHFSYHFDGQRIDMYRDESSRQIYRIVDPD